MIINLSPQISNKSYPSISVNGDVLTMNGEAFDFSSMGDGDLLPASAVQSSYFDPLSVVEKGPSGIELTLLLPMMHGEESESVLYPRPVTVDEGVVDLPVSSIHPVLEVGHE